MHKKLSHINNMHTNNSHKNQHTNITRINIFCNHYSNNKHKAKIYNQCMYTQIIIKKILLFFFTVYKNEWK